MDEISAKQVAITDECSISKQKMVPSERKNRNCIFRFLNLTAKSQKNTWVSLQAFCQRCLSVLKKGIVRKEKEWNREAILKILFITQTVHFDQYWIP